MSDSPRTDTFYREHPICEHETSAHPEDCEAWLDYGRDLERENADLRQQIKVVADHLGCGPDNLIDYSRKVGAALLEFDGLRESIAAMMMRHALATGHGDTIADLLGELDWQLTEREQRAADLRRRVVEALDGADYELSAVAADLGNNAICQGTIRRVQAELRLLVRALSDPQQPEQDKSHE